MSRRYKVRTVEARLLSHLVRQPNGCLEWDGYTLRGYGRLWIGKQRVPVHRLAWEFANGRPVPAGKMILHSCDNPPCCEPTHLRPGTAADNSADMVSRGRGHKQGVDHCPDDHPYDEANTYVNPYSGVRQCRICHRAAAKRSYAIKTGRHGD